MRLRVNRSDARIFLVSLLFGWFGLSINIAQAMPPPAGNVAILAEPPKCGMLITKHETNPVGKKYVFGDLMYFRTRIKVLGGASKVHLSYSVNQATSLTYQNFTNILGTFSKVNTPGLVFTTSNLIAPDNEVEIQLNFKIATTANQETIRVTVAANGDAVGCTNVSTATGDVLVDNSSSYDLQASLRPTVMGLSRNNVSQEFIGGAINNGPSGLVTEDLRLQFQTSAPVTIFATRPPATSTGSGPIAREDYLDISVPRGGRLPDFAIQYQAKPTATPGNYPVSFCVNAINSVINARDANLNNNCLVATLTIYPYEVQKLWTDTQNSADRVFQPGDQVPFTLRIHNIDTKIVNGIEINDLLSVTCDPNYPANCTSTSWDSSLTWVNTAGGIIQNGGQKIVWQNVSLNPGESRDYNVTAQVVAKNNLINALSQYGLQSRCNTVGVFQSLSNSLDPQAFVCWTYETGTDLALTKTFGDSSKVKQIRQGAMDSYKINVINNGPNPAFLSRLTDLPDDTDAHLPPNNPNGHVFEWVPETIVGAYPFGDDKIQWTLDYLDGTNDNYFDVNKNVLLSPSFVVACNAPVGKKITNLALASMANTDTNSANDSNLDPATGDGDVVATIASGKNNFDLSLTASSLAVYPNDPVKSKTDLTYALSNKQLPDNSVNVAVPRVTLTTTIPKIFTIQSTSLPPSKTTTTASGTTLEWIVNSIAVGTTQNITVTTQVDPNVLSGTAQVSASARSLNAASDGSCGVDNDSVTIDVKGPDIRPLKQALDSEAGPDEPVHYQLELKNSSPDVTITRSAGEGLLLSDTFPDALTYVSTDECKVVSLTTNVESACVNPDQPLNPDVTTGTNDKIEWSILKLPAQTTVRYKITTKVRSTYQPDTCPNPVDNVSTLTDSKFTINAPVSSGPATVTVYPIKCLSGNIYSRNSTSSGSGAAGININSSDIIVDPNSILSSNGSVACTDSVKCDSIPFKIANYGTTESVGIKFESIVNRMYRNTERIKGQASVLNKTSLTGSVDLLNINGNETSTAAKYPDGRIWVVNGDLTVVTPITFTGKGTIIVRGNLTIDGTGNGKMQYAVDNSPQHAVGFIVLPKAGPNNIAIANTGNIRISSAVNRLVGAYFAPGTLTATAATDSPITTGILTFDSGSTSQLRPAKGLFIARQFNINREKIALQYDPLLNSADGAPPGFTFTGGQSDIQEGP